MIMYHFESLIVERVTIKVLDKMLVNLVGYTSVNSKKLTMELFLCGAKEEENPSDYFV